MIPDFAVLNLTKENLFPPLMYKHMKYREQHIILRTVTKQNWECWEGEGRSLQQQAGAERSKMGKPSILRKGTKSRGKE